MSNKIVFSQKGQEVSNALAKAANDLEDFVSTFFDRGYNIGGADQIVDADIASLGIDAATLNSFVTTAQQLANFFGNAAVTQGDYDSSVNKMRTDI